MNLSIDLIKAKKIRKKIKYSITLKIGIQDSKIHRTKYCYYEKLVDLTKHKNIFSYQFTNIRFKSEHRPDVLFEKYGYERE